MANPLQQLSQFVRSAAIHPLSGSGGSSVPLSRVVNATGPYLTVNGGASANLSADITLAVTVSGGGSAVVGTGRTLTGTAPVTINGVSTPVTLANDLTIAVPVFAGTSAGLVPVGTNDGTKFLSQTGWQVGIGVGVTSLAGTSPIQVSAATGAVTISVLQAAIANAGIVPATGGADATKFLCATNPLTWSVPGAAGFVLLQASTPGIDQVGNTHVNGVAIADTAGVFGAAARSGNEPLYVKQASSTTPPMIASYRAGSPSPGIVFRSSRGSEASPSATLDADELVSLFVEPYNAAGAFSRVEWGMVRQKGASIGTHTPFDIFLLAAGNTAVNQGQLMLGHDGLSGVGDVNWTQTPKSGFEVGTSLGLQHVAKSASFSTDDSAVGYLCDATGAQINVTLFPAVGRKHRVISFKKVDTTVNHVLITPAAGLIEGVGSYELVAGYESVELVSDDSNWWVRNSSRSYTHETKTGINEQFSNFTGPQLWTTTINLVSNRTYIAGGRFKVVMGLQIRTNASTPTLKLEIIHNGSQLGNTNNITLFALSGVRNARLEFEALILSGNLVSVGNAKVFIPQEVGAAIQWNVYHMAIGSVVFNNTGNFGLQATFGTANNNNLVNWTDYTIEYIPPGYHQ